MNPAAPEEEMGRERCDILILGSGIAGLYTALKVSDLGRVMVLTKKNLEDSSTGFAQGGIAAAIAPGDSPLLHYEDTIAAGDGLCDEETVHILVEEGPDGVRDLAVRGVRFDMVGEDFELTREAAHSRRRILHARGDATGEEIRRGLEDHVRNDPHIVVRENEFAIDLVVENGRCCGVVSRGPDRRRRMIRAGAVILATGGSGQLYRHSTNPDIATGDGIAMAYRAGAEVMDMEFTQFHPTALYMPNPPPGRHRPHPRTLISEAVRGEGAVLRNVRGRRFMPSYHPQAELAPRDVVARAIAQEMEKTAAAYVLLDTPPIRNVFPRRFPTIHRKCLEQGIDPVKEPIPVAPAAHYIMGGVRTDMDGRTSLPDLYACGEAACTGVHGANRLASNSLLEGVVFGARIARALERELPSAVVVEDREGPPAPPEPRPIAATLDVAAAWHSVQLIMWNRVGLRRHETSLLFALAFLEDLGRDLGLLLPAGAGALPAKTAPPGTAAIGAEATNPEPPYPDRAALELVNLATNAWLVTTAALERRESRGAHYRTDYPTRNDREWRRHIVISGGRLRIEPLFEGAE